MVVVPLSQPAIAREVHPGAAEADSNNWARIAAGGTLLAAGLLLLTGRRRAGMIAAASGAALAMLDQRQTVSAWWRQVPVYLDNVQNLLNGVQNGVQQVAEKREKLRRVFLKNPNG
jgi:hypothetical protein